MMDTSTDAASRQRTERSQAVLPPRRGKRVPYVLDPAGLPDHIDWLFRAAWALCGSPIDAEDLVQTTFVRVLARPRIIRRDNERGYLLRALRNTYASRYRESMRRPAVVPLHEDDAPVTAEPTITSREIMKAIASTPPLYREAVIAVDVLGLSYAEAARSLRTREETITSRLHRGRKHVARELEDPGV
jgi:RNA polymerase sigma-70 factor (ECF subfamily)